MGMTMTRSEKASQTGMLKGIIGGHQEPAASPKLRAEMVKDHGAPTYTGKAWIANRMGRGELNFPVSDLREQRAATKIRFLRKITRH